MILQIWPNMIFDACHICFICQLSEILRSVNYDSLSSILAQRNNISFHTIICQSSFSSSSYPCLLFSHLSLHFTFFIFNLCSRFTTCVPSNSPFLSKFLLYLSGWYLQDLIFSLCKLWADKFCFFQLWHFSNPITALQTCSFSVTFFSQCSTISDWTSEGRGNKCHS